MSSLPFGDQSTGDCWGFKRLIISGQDRVKIRGHFLEGEFG